MFSLSKKTDYALMALCHLTAGSSDRPVNAREIAESYDIPLELLAKILQRLAKQGFVMSTPGPNGGYRLAKPPVEISIADVMNAIDGPVALAHCMRGARSTCHQWAKCSVRNPLSRVQEAMNNLLSQITLTEIAS